MANQERLLVFLIDVLVLINRRTVYEAFLKTLDEQLAILEARGLVFLG